VAARYGRIAKMKIDFQREMENVISGFGEEKPSLLLHACCAPCSSAVLERIEPYFNITIYFYNPNIYPFEEYSRRFRELNKLLDRNGMADRVALINGDYDDGAFYDSTAGFEDAPEGGARCPRCFYLRLSETAKKADSLGFDYFATTLTVSPHKNAQVINALGEDIARSHSAKWLPSDFKKKDGYLRSIQLSKEYDLYRQDYCGCRFALREC
jgi:hypothetical protein